MRGVVVWIGQFMLCYHRDGGQGHDLVSRPCPLLFHACAGNPALDSQRYADLLGGAFGSMSR